MSKYIRYLPKTSVAEQPLSLLPLRPVCTSKKVLNKKLNATEKKWLVWKESKNCFWPCARSTSSAPPVKSLSLSRNIESLSTYIKYYCIPCNIWVKQQIDMTFKLLSVTKSMTFPAAGSADLCPAVIRDFIGSAWGEFGECTLGQKQYLRFYPDKAFFQLHITFYFFLEVHSGCNGSNDDSYSAKPHSLISTVRILKLLKLKKLVNGFFLDIKERRHIQCLL